MVGGRESAPLDLDRCNQEGSVMIIFTKHLWGLKFYCGLENIHYWNKKESHFVNEPQYRYLKKQGNGQKLWDLGSSLGFYSLWAATYPYNYRVTAFDLSSRATNLLEKSVRANHLDTKVDIVPGAVTRDYQWYDPPWTAHQSNKVIPIGEPLSRRCEVSIPWKNAVEIYGKPHVIKMDIEGSELAMLKESKFLQFIADEKIDLFVECHSPEAMLICDLSGFNRQDNHRWLTW